MEYFDSMGYLIITFNYNVTVIGKIWLTLMILLRMVMVVLAGYPLYQDEQERFICNTLQPGCSNVCYDIFSPMSNMRYWLIQTVTVFLPYALFSVHVFHKVMTYMATSNDNCRKSNSSTYHGVGLQMEILDFSQAYLVHIVLKILLELGFGVGQYFLFGILVPSRFSCSQEPCTNNVDCYISRPTEKSLMMIFIWGTGIVSLILSFVDLICIFHRRSYSEKIKKQLLLLENDSLKGGCCSETPPHTKLAVTSDQMVIYPNCPSHNLEKACEQVKGDSHSLPSLEGETASFQTESSRQDVGKSNMNANSNKTCSWQVNVVSTGSNTFGNEHHLLTQRQARAKKVNCSNHSLADGSQMDKNSGSKNKKSEWV
ncbi:gap junction delta-4 protein [Bufo bufo]|uniref:gap junction delta-4 protein n=1 Tax=Bufo bufo TaxID=8384 RepID=UPI001ABED5F5|nr:gap junction delta-4 protein [Bufo bufo]